MDIAYGGFVGYVWVLQEEYESVCSRTKSNAVVAIDIDKRHAKSQLKVKTSA